MKKRILGILAAALAVLAGLGVARVAPAAAADGNDPDGWNWTYSAVIGSETYQIRWKESVRAASTARSNATITVTDRSADGRGQRVQWRVSGASSWNYCYNTTGAGTSKVCSVSKGKFIQYKLCLKDGSVIGYCAPQDGFQT